MDVIDKTDDEPLLVSPEAIVEHLGAMDLSSSGLLEIVDAHGERKARAIKRTAREIAGNIVLPAESTKRAAAEQAALAAIPAPKTTGTTTRKERGCQHVSHTWVA